MAELSNLEFVGVGNGSKKSKCSCLAICLIKTCRPDWLTHKAPIAVNYPIDGRERTYKRYALKDAHIDFNIKHRWLQYKRFA